MSRHASRTCLKRSTPLPVSVRAAPTPTSASPLAGRSHSARSVTLAARAKKLMASSDDGLVLVLVLVLVQVRVQLASTGRPRRRARLAASRTADALRDSGSASMHAPGSVGDASG